MESYRVVGSEVCRYVEFLYQLDGPWRGEDMVRWKHTSPLAGSSVKKFNNNNYYIPTLLETLMCVKDIK